MHMSKLLQIQAQLGNYEIIRPGREFVKAGELYKLSRKEMQLRYFILVRIFSRCIYIRIARANFYGSRINKSAFLASFFFYVTNYFFFPSFLRSQLNDCLLYTSYYGSMFSLTVKYKLPLAGMKVGLPAVEDYNNEFSIISTTRSFTLRAKYVYGKSSHGTKRSVCIYNLNKIHVKF